MGAKWCDSKPIIIINDLGNAIDLDKNFPHLEIPNYQQVSAIVPEDSVELTHQGERFWVIVDIVNIIEGHCEFVGKVTSDLNYTHPFITEDCIAFEGPNILNIYSHEWKNELRISPNE